MYNLKQNVTRQRDVKSSVFVTRYSEIIKNVLSRSLEKYVYQTILADFMFAPCINSIKSTFIIPTDAHNYKNMCISWNNESVFILSDIKTGPAV
jgi:hypothetical protein